MLKQLLLLFVLLFSQYSFGATRELTCKDQDKLWTVIVELDEFTPLKAAFYKRDALVVSYTRFADFKVTRLGKQRFIDIDLHQAKYLNLEIDRDGVITGAFLLSNNPFRFETRISCQ